MIILGDFASPRFVDLCELKEALPNDMVIVNLEGAIADQKTDALLRKSIVFNTKESVASMQTLDVRLVTVANNHFFDLGNKVAYCRAYLQGNGIQMVGAGETIEKANRGVCLSEDGIDYVVFSFCWHMTGGKRANSSRAGVAPADKKNIEACIRRAKSENPNAKIILIMHWGMELEKYPEPMHAVLARYAIDCGADMIIGHHPHCIQPIEKYKGKYIFYSIGNFYIEEHTYFDGRIDYPAYAHTSLAVHWKGDEITVYCLENSGAAPRCTGSLTIEQAIDKYACPALADEYADWFSVHRVKRKLIPIYDDPDAEFSNLCKDVFLQVRGLGIRLLLLLHLKKGRCVDRTYYMGSLPPPYGGVTVKNELLYNELKDFAAIYTTHKFNILSTVKALLLGNKFILATGHTEHLLRLTVMMTYLRPRAMRRSIVFVMGGNLADLIENDPRMIRLMQRYRRLYVEPKGMLTRLRAMGIGNISWLPNCRKRPQVDYIPAVTTAPLRCVFFARITPDKGADVVLDAAAQLPQVQIDFYGPVAPIYEQPFQKAVADLPNVQYKGEFTARDEALYQLLHEYDLVLLPSRWIYEGVPGTLVEGKIAGVPAIVSDICYNAEIVEDGVSGIVLKENTANALAEAIGKMDKDRQLLYALKCGAKQSAEVYYIDNYVEDITEILTRGGALLRAIIFLSAVRNTLHQRSLYLSFECSG